LGDYAMARDDFARAREGITEPARRAEMWRQEGLTGSRRGDTHAALAAFAAAEAEGGGGNAAGQLPGAGRLAPALNRAEVYDFLGDPDALEAAIQQARTLLRTERLALPTGDTGMGGLTVRALVAMEAPASASPRPYAGTGGIYVVRALGGNAAPTSGSW